ncbi:MAG TPA: TIR domain-containing protein [Allosphingosinicella sp.]|jgi:hypothetical protein
MGRDIFISHSSQDRDVAHAACRRLEEQGFGCWIAPRDILPGQDYGAAIVEGIRGAKLFLLIFSSRSNDSAQVKREVERAASAGVPILPFRVEEVTPAPALEYFISGSHWLDAIEPPLERHLDYLSDTVARSLAPEQRRPSPARSGPAIDPAASRRPRNRSSTALAAFGGAALVAAGGSAFWSLAGGDSGGATENRQAAKANITIFTRRAVPLPSARQLRLRAAPSETAPVVRLISPDEVFRVAPRNGDWWPARLTNGDEGFVAHLWIRVIDEETPPAATPAAADSPRKVER